MQKYVFITMNIGGINGAEQYIYNKMNYLKQQGQQVFVFSGRPEKILIDGFREYKSLVNPALRFYPSCLSRAERERNVQWMLSVIDLQEGETCIIESSNVTSSLWSELVAKELGCRHLAINLTENHHYGKAMRDFLMFKLDRHELAGIMDDSVGKMLKNPELPIRPDMRVFAYCNNVVQDCEDRYSSQLDENADCVIGSIGRLEKEYVPKLIEQLSTFFAANPEKHYNLLLIGGCADKRHLKKIKETIGQCGNVTLVTTGNLYPIPRKLIKQVDLFVSAAGSALVSYYERVPSIRIEHVTAEPLGIIGYDYMPRDEKTPVPLKDRTLIDCLNQVLRNSITIQYIEDFEVSYYRNMYAEFDRQMSFGEGNDLGNYYDVLGIQYTSSLYKLCSVVCRMFGVKFTYAILECLRKLIRGASNL